LTGIIATKEELLVGFDPRQRIKIEQIFDRAELDGFTNNPVGWTC
jgi:hypothetical protein